MNKLRNRLLSSVCYVIGNMQKGADARKFRLMNAQVIDFLKEEEAKKRTRKRVRR